MTENNKYCTADSYGEAKDLACSSAVLSERYKKTVYSNIIFWDRISETIALENTATNNLSQKPYVLLQTDNSKIHVYCQNNGLRL